MRKIISIITLTLITLVPANADEGMWLIQNINSALEKKMQERGLALSAGEIYNADAPGASVSDAVISLGFYCTGSIISDNGLMITNHHCAYSDIFAMSTPEHNYLEEGYWAVTEDLEKPIPGKEAFFLKRVIDVTGEVERLRSEYEASGQKLGSRKLSYLMEKKYGNDTGLEAFFSSMWAGEKCYIALYEVYTDLRLVAAPPVSVAAFGGDIDNWEWPQQKCDFAMYRIYTAPDGSPADYSEDNVPLKPVRKLEISLDGYKPGDFTMVIGYPGKTDRYSSSMETDFEEKVALPIANKLRIRQMAIMKKWMDFDPGIWLKYSDTYFGLSNVGEMKEGEAACLKRFGSADAKRAEEAGLQAWIDADPARRLKWGTLLHDLDSCYSAFEEVERNKTYYRETLVRGSIIARTIMRMNAARGDFEKMKTALDRGMSETDQRVEKELLQFAVQQYFENVDSRFFSPFHNELLSRFGNDYQAMLDYVWEGTCIASAEAAAAFVSPEQFASDRLKLLLLELPITTFNADSHNNEYHQAILELQREYTRALYEKRLADGIEQYPDANSTMRISYGTVGPLAPRDGVQCHWQTFSSGIEEKYDPSQRDYRPSDRFMGMLRKGEWGRWADCDDCHGGEMRRGGSHRVGDGLGPQRQGRGRKGAGHGNAAMPGRMPVNFLTDNDITGGNSGSPVLDSKGRLIGLAFDGNKESLASDLSYTPGYNKCVCVDIRYVLWTLDHYAGMSRIITELGL